MNGVDEVDEVLAWLQGSEARTAARVELGRLRLPLNLEDDVVQEASLRVLHTRAHGGEAPVNPVAYAYRTVQNTVRDLYRRSRRRVVEETIDDLPPGIEEGTADVDLDGLVEDDYRRAIHGRLAVRPWVGATALNQLTFTMHPEVPVPRGAPRPESWTALWLAGKTDCFPDDEHPENDAMRKRRSRALGMVTEQLRAIVEAALGGAKP